jgi:mycofactocin system glycosyltransferase
VTEGPVDRRFRLDVSYRRPADGRVIVGGSPLRLVTLAEAALPVVRALERDGLVDATSPAVERLLDRLVELGIVHPLPAGSADHGGRSSAGLDLTVVVPVHRAGAGAAPPAARRVGGGERRGVGGGAGASRRYPTVVVDDASDPPLPVPTGSERSLLVRLDTNRGPGGARNAGLAHVDTPFVAFVDDDVEVSDDDLAALLAWFDDPRVALVAPRIRAVPGGDVLARFEATRSPLDLGPAPARVAASTRVSYVPAAVLVCRTDALRTAGGFDEALRWGEDVDLVWRLQRAGWRCRYEPTVVARHRTRGDLRAWLTQRFRYGTSAAPLARRHPGALAPVRMSGWSAAAWAPVALGLPLVGIGIGAGTAVALVRKLRAVPPAEALRLAGLGNLHAGRLLAATLTRSWWPIAAVAAVCSRRARRLLAAAVVVPIVLDATSERPALDPLRYACLHVLDDLAYGAGVWWGAWTERSAAALLPSFEAWPPRKDSVATRRRAGRARRVRAALGGRARRQLRR